MNALNCSVLATRLRCDSAAPFESPVVPPVYCRNSRSSPLSAHRREGELRALRERIGRTRRRSSSRASTAGLGSAAPVPSPRPTLMTCLTAVLPMISASVADTPLKMTMISTPGVVELVLELARRVERIDVHLHGAGADDAQHGEREGRRCWAASPRCGRPSRRRACTADRPRSRARADRCRHRSASGRSSGTRASSA